jgi:hypothetical protein
VRAVALLLTVAAAVSCSAAGVERRADPPLVRRASIAPAAPAAATAERATSATSTAPAPAVPQFDQLVLTPDGWDGYQLDASSTRVAVSAPPVNSGGNLRAIYLPRNHPEATDEQVCATWTGEVGDEVQEGLALRVHDGGDTGRAITVTKNVWAYAGWYLNVHLWGKTGSTWTRMQVAQLDLGFAAMVRNKIQGLPWRVCARVDGPVLTVKLWAASQPEPSWSDATHTNHATLPEGWLGAGRVGWYAGHLKAGNFLVYDGIAAAVSR